MNNEDLTLFFHVNQKWIMRIWPYSFNEDLTLFFHDPILSFPRMPVWNVSLKADAVSLMILKNCHTWKKYAKISFPSPLTTWWHRCITVPGLGGKTGNGQNHCSPSWKKILKRIYTVTSRESGWIWIAVGWIRASRVKPTETIPTLSQAF